MAVLTFWLLSFGFWQIGFWQFGFLAFGLFGFLAMWLFGFLASVGWERGWVPRPPACAVLRGVGFLAFLIFCLGLFWASRPVGANSVGYHVSARLGGLNAVTTGGGFRHRLVTLSCTSRTPGVRARDQGSVALSLYCVLRTSLPGGQSATQRRGAHARRADTVHVGSPCKS